MLYAFTHLTWSETLVRTAWAFLLSLVGVAILARPEFGCGAYDRICEGPVFSREQFARVATVLAGRRAAESPRYNWRKAVGMLAFVAAFLELLPVIPYAIPYAALCLGLAASELVTYVGMRRAAQRRAAALVPRSPLQTFPPVLLWAAGAMFVGVIVLTAVPTLRVAGFVVAIATVMLIWVAWQVAASRALLVGDDPKVEYAVDQRLRTTRVVNLVFLACSPAVALVGSSLPMIPSEYRSIDNVAFWVIYAAFFVVLYAVARSVRSSAARFERDIA